MQTITTIGLDIAKSVFQVLGEMSLSAMCGRLRVGKSFLHVCSSLGRCSHVFGL